MMIFRSPTAHFLVNSVHRNRTLYISANTPVSTPLVELELADPKLRQNSQGKSIRLSYGQKVCRIATRVQDSPITRLVFVHAQRTDQWLGTNASPGRLWQNRYNHSRPVRRRILNQLHFLSDRGKARQPHQYKTKQVLRKKSLPSFSFAVVLPSLVLARV